MIFVVLLFGIICFYFLVGLIVVLNDCVDCSMVLLFWVMFVIVFGCCCLGVW